MSSRDIPSSLPDFVTGWTNHLADEITINKRKKQLIEEDQQPADHEVVKKVEFKNLWPAFTCGAGLFSDGYVNASIGSVNTILKIIYGKTYSNSHATSNVSSISFVGTVVGQLSFGYLSDNIARKGSLLLANVMLIIFTVLSAVGTWGANGSPQGLFAALTTFRFFLGIAIGAEYPTGSVIASEFANQLPSGKRNRYFIWATNLMLASGYIVAAFVPLVLLWIFSERHLSVVWRLTLGLGAVPPFILFFMRLKLTDSSTFDKMHMKRAKVPYLLILKYYWFRLIIVSIIWFVYDFASFSFDTFSSAIINKVVHHGSLYKTFGWNTVFNLFSLPGCLIGALAADYFGPRLTLALGMGLQGVVGFIMATTYGSLREHTAPFVIVFGIFKTLGQFGPGNNIGLLAAKTSSTSVRGQYYGIAAAVGKVGAFVGTWIFPVITKKYSGPEGNNLLGNQVPFYISSSLCIFAATIALFLCPSVGQDAINREDENFLQYLADNNYDISQLGNELVEEEYVSSGSSINIENKSSKPTAKVSEKLEKSNL